MLARPYEPVTGLAELAGLGVPGVRHAMRRLAQLGLTRPSDQRHGQVWAVPPHAAMEILLARQQADLAARQRQLEDCRVAAAELVAGYPLPQSLAVTESEHALGLDQVTDVLAVL